MRISCRKCGEPASFYRADGTRVRTRSAEFKSLSRDEQRRTVADCIPLCRLHADSTDWSDPTEHAKVCVHCEKLKPLPEFYRRGRGRHSWCKACVTKDNRKRRQKNKPQAVRIVDVRTAWLGHPHGPLLIAYEDAVSRVTVMISKALSSKTEGERRRNWAGFYAAREELENMRVKVSEVLREDA